MQIYGGSRLHRHKILMAKQENLSLAKIKSINNNTINKTIYEYT